MEQNDLSKVFTRSTIPIEDKDLINYLYEEVLLFYESEDFCKLNNCNISSNPFKQEIKQIKYIHSENPKDFETCFVKRGNNNCLNQTINVKELDNQLFFVSSGNKAKYMIKHIRNAFSHNLLLIEDDKDIVLTDDKNIILGDFLANGNQPDFNSPTMLCRMSIKNLKVLIKTIKSMTKDK